ncbi:MAG: 5-carboxymethyl-2-hydroxymuconate isomerase [Pseudomonadota bacterium]
MPHLTLDYAPELEAEVDMPALCERLRQAMVETGLFPLAGIRVRAFAASHVAIADGDPAHLYLDMSIRLRRGRDLEARKAAVAHVFAAAEEVLAPMMARRSLALSMEMRDIDPDLAPKAGSVRAFLKQGADV